MARRPKKKDVNEALIKMRLLLAAAALFVLIAGLTLQTYLVLYRPDMQLMTLLFSFFFISGVLLFAASAFINSDMVKAFLSASGLFRSSER